MKLLPIALATAAIITIAALSTKAEAAYYILDYENCGTTTNDGTINPAVFLITSADQMGGVVVSDHKSGPGYRYVPKAMLRYFDSVNRRFGADDLHKCATFTGHMDAMGGTYHD